MRRHDLTVTHWGARFMGRRFVCAVGRGGISATKQEGDGVTPAGTFRILAAFHRSDRISAPAIPIGLNDIWSDDPCDPAYNTGLSARAHPFGHERLRRADHLYDLIAVPDFNLPDPTPGAGSAIFLHVWRKARFPTAGCLAFARADLAWILDRWTERSRVVIRPWRHTAR